MVFQKKFQPAVNQGDGIQIQSGERTKEETKALNAYLDTLQNKVYETLRLSIDKNEIVTVDNLRNVLKGLDLKLKMIMVIFQQHNDQMKSLVGKDFSPATLERYKTSFEHTKAFIKWKYVAEE